MGFISVKFTSFTGYLNKKSLFIGIITKSAVFSSNSNAKSAAFSSNYFSNSFIFFLYSSTPGWLNGLTPRISADIAQLISKK